MSCALDGVAGVAGVLVVVVLWVVEFGVVVVVVLLDGVVVVVVLWLAASVLVLCASASVPVRSSPAARIDTFFMIWVSLIGESIETFDEAAQLVRWHPPRGVLSNRSPKCFLHSGLKL